MKTLFGGSKQTSSSQSGFSQLPPEVQAAWSDLATQATKTLSPVNNSAGMFQLPGLSGGANNALQQIYKGFTPDANQLSSDINMQMNPFDDSVISTINREAGGKNSALSSYLSNAGQFGSNRGALGANDIDLTRLNQIGTFKQGQFQNSLSNALNVLPQLRAQSAQGALGAGQFEQGQAFQNQQSPVSALQALAKIIGVLPDNGGSTATSTGTASNGMFKPISLFG